MAGMKFFQEHSDWAPTILRVFFGVAFVVAALNKIMGLEMMKGFFEGMFGATLGAPALYLTIAVELIGGIALLLNWHAACAALFLSAVMVVAIVKTFKLGASPGILGMLQEMLIMNTGGSNLPVTFTYLAGLLSLAFSGCRQCKTKK